MYKHTVITDITTFSLGHDGSVCHVSAKMYAKPR